MKKNIFLLLVVFIGVTSLSTLQAQSKEGVSLKYSVKENGKYAISATQENHFRGAVKTGEQFKKEAPHVAFEVVVYGPIVKDLAENEDLRPLLEVAKKHEIRIVACEVAMEKMNVKHADFLDPYIQTTPNAFAYLFGLQDEGFKLLMP